MYLADPFDIFLSANATKAARGVMNTAPVSQLILNETSPGYAVVPVNATDAQWQAFIKSDVTPTIHPVGSVAMGAKDEGGCVDSNLVVYGTKNVRVAGKFPHSISFELGILMLLALRLFSNTHRDQCAFEWYCIRYCGEGMNFINQGHVFNVSRANMYSGGRHHQGQSLI